MFKKISDGVVQLKADSVILDGEVVAVGNRSAPWTKLGEITEGGGLIFRLKPNHPKVIRAPEPLTPVKHIEPELNGKENR